MSKVMSLCMGWYMDVSPSMPKEMRVWLFWSLPQLFIDLDGFELIWSKSGWNLRRRARNKLHISPKTCIAVVEPENHLMQLRWLWHIVTAITLSLSAEDLILTSSPPSGLRDDHCLIILCFFPLLVLYLLACRSWALRQAVSISEWHCLTRAIQFNT